MSVVILALYSRPPGPTSAADTVAPQWDKGTILRDTSTGGTTFSNLYFVTGTYPNLKRGCHHHQIGINYLFDAIFKIGLQRSEITFSPYDSASRIHVDRDKILVYKAMRNPIMTMKNPFVCWLTRNSKWLQLTPTEITVSAKF